MVTRPAALDTDDVATDDLATDDVAPDDVATEDGHDEALAFVARALEVTPRRIEGVDRQSMELILLLHRVTNVVVYDIESRVHRPPDGVGPRSGRCSPCGSAARSSRAGWRRPVA